MQQHHYLLLLLLNVGVRIWCTVFSSSFSRIMSKYSGDDYVNHVERPPSNFARFSHKRKITFSQFLPAKSWVDHSEKANSFVNLRRIPCLVSKLTLDTPKMWAVSEVILVYYIDATQDQKYLGQFMSCHSVSNLRCFLIRTSCHCSFIILLPLD